MAEKSRPSPRSASSVDRQIGARIRARRKERGLSQSALADALGVTFQQVQKYERGANRVAAGVLFELAKTLGCRAEFLLPAQGEDAADVNDLDDPQVAEVHALVARLNGEGRRVLIAIAKTLASDAKFSKRG